MKRYLLILITLVGGFLCSYSQTGMNIYQLLNSKYTTDPKVTETYMSGTGSKFLNKHRLTEMMTFKGPAATYGSIVEQLVKKDATGAIGKDIRYKNGKLYYALYTLKPKNLKNSKVNRYLYFLNTGAVKGKKVMIIYLEGYLYEEEAKRLVKSMSTK